MRITFNCSVRFLNTILRYIFLITGFSTKGNGNGIITFKFNPWKKSSIDQSNQSYHKDIKNSFLKFCLSAYFKSIIKSN